MKEYILDNSKIYSFLISSGELKESEILCLMSGVSYKISKS